VLAVKEQRAASRIVQNQFAEARGLTEFRKNVFKAHRVFSCSDVVR
jgi:hypothetical protein